jgi:hypothetical protein
MHLANRGTASDTALALAGATANGAAFALDELSDSPVKSLGYYFVVTSYAAGGSVYGFDAVVQTKVGASSTYVDTRSRANSVTANGTYFIDVVDPVLDDVRVQFSRRDGAATATIAAYWSYDYGNVNEYTAIHCTVSYAWRASTGVVVYYLNVTTGCGGAAEDLTVTLNGTAFAITGVAANSTTAQVATAIATRSGGYTGWTASSDGTVVTFTKAATGWTTGAFTLASTGTAAGTFSAAATTNLRLPSAGVTHGLFLVAVVASRTAGNITVSLQGSVDGITYFNLGISTGAISADGTTHVDCGNTALVLPPYIRASTVVAGGFDGTLAVTLRSDAGLEQAWPGANTRGATRPTQRQAYSRLPVGTGNFQLIDYGSLSASGGAALIGITDSPSGVVMPSSPAISPQSFTTDTVQGALQQLGAQQLAVKLADPGNAGACQVLQSGSVSLVTAGAETRTCAAPTFVGQVMVFSFKTDGGNCVITFGSAINAAGNTIGTFDDAGDVLALIGVDIGGTLFWRVLLNIGVTLS